MNANYQRRRVEWLKNIFSVLVIRAFIKPSDSENFHYFFFSDRGNFN